MRVCIAGAGAFGVKHIEGIARIEGVEITSLVGRRLEQTTEVADKYGIAHATTDLSESLGRKDVDAVMTYLRAQDAARARPTGHQ